MAQPRLGQKRSDGKVYAGENYGYQNPATFSKLKEQGKFKVGAQALDRATQAVSRVIPKPVKDYANAVQSAAAKNAETTRRNNEKTAIGRFQNRVTSQPSATERVLKGVSDKTNVDQRIVNTAANAAQAAIAKKALGGTKAPLGGTKPQPLPARSVGAAARADVAGRTVSATKKLPKSARPTGTVKAGSAAPSKALTQARRSVVRPNTEQVARQASGPAHTTSDPNQLAPGNNPARQRATNFHLKEQLKEKGVTAYAEQATKGYDARVKPQPRGQDFTNYMPNRGRVSPTDKGRLAELDRTRDARRLKALEGLRGQARKDADNAFSRAETKLRKNVKYDAQREAKQFQKAQEAKRQKGSTPASMESMSADIAKRPRTQPIRNTSTTTTGTRRVAENPTSGTSRRGVTARVVQGKNGDVTIRPKGNLGGTFASNQANKPGADGKTVIGAGKSQQTGGTPRGIVGYREVNGKRIPIRANNGSTRERSATNVAGRTINPATGRPDRLGVNGKAVSNKPSANRTRGTNPAENFSAETRAREPLGRKPSKSAPTTNEESTSAFQKLTPGERQRVSPGLVVRTPQKPGQRAGGTGLTRRYQQNASGKQVKHNPDIAQRRNGRKIGRLGQAGQSNVDNPELTKRAAANKARAAATSKTTSTPPKRTPERAAQIRERSRAATQGSKAAKGLSDKDVRALTDKYNRELKNLKDKENARRRAAGKEPNIDTTHFNGEVRLQGSKYSMDPQAKNLVDGSVSRATYLPGQRPKPQVRSAEASAKSKETMEAVRRRAAIRKAAEQAMKAKKAKSRSIGGRARAKGTGETRRLSGNKQQRTIRSLLQRLRGG